MFKYFIRRLIFAIPTLFGITLICFVIVNLAPGGPIERQLAKMRFGSSSGVEISGSSSHNVSKNVILELEKRYGFDKPLMVRYWIWLKKLASFDFGESFVYEEPVTAIISSRLPVSMQFGLFSFLLSYLISIPLGVYKAVRDGSSMDKWSSVILILNYSLPALVVGVLLKTYFTGSVFVDWFPVGDLYSDEYFEKNFFGKILDRMHHFVLPLICYTLAHFTVLTVLMKNSMMECIQADYVRTARAKGLSEKKVLLKHSLKNALIPIMTGFGNFLQFFMAGALIIEKIFNLDGIGLLGYTAAVDRDFHILLALLFIQAGLNILGRFVSDISLSLVDPRITYTK